MARIFFIFSEHRPGEPSLRLFPVRTVIVPRQQKQGYLMGRGVTKMKINYTKKILFISSAKKLSR